MNRLKFYWKLYYPVVLSFLSFLYSVSLWFSGYQLEGIFVGIWVPSINVGSTVPVGHAGAC